MSIFFDRMVKIARWLIYAVPAVIFGWLVYKDAVVSGVLDASYDFRSRSPFISVLRPQQRISEIQYNADGRAFQDIKGEPVYFDVRLPRKFESAKVNVVYKNYDQPVIELGALVDRDRAQFDFEPVENRAIEYFFQDKFHWTYVQEENTYLFQKKQRFSTIDEFMKHFPAPQSVAAYHYDVNQKFVLPSYRPKEGGIDIRKTLRGTHRMYTYIKDEPMDFVFTFQDVNRHAGDDYVSISVIDKNENENVFEDFIKVDENASDNSAISKTYDYTLYIPELPEGVYRIDLITPTDDIFIRNIVTKQDYLVFINRVYFGDNAGFSDDSMAERLAQTKLYTNGRIVSASTAHREGLQTILAGKQVLEVRETHKKTYLETKDEKTEILLARNDAALETRGVFAFSKENFFNPDILTLSDGRELNADYLEYVITEYRPPKELSDGWKESEAVFEISRYYTGDGLLRFVLSLPYLEEKHRGISLSEIRVELTDQPISWNFLMKKIFEYVRK